MRILVLIGCCIALISVGCCGPMGCGPGCGAQVGCNDCNGTGLLNRGYVPSGPLLQLQALKRQAVCGSGCGETYIGEWTSTPPDCADPCGCGNQFVGGASKCQPFCWQRGALARGLFGTLLGVRYCTGDQSSASCGCSSCGSAEPVAESCGCDSCGGGAYQGGVQDGYITDGTVLEASPVIQQSAPVLYSPAPSTPACGCTAKSCGSGRPVAAVAKQVNGGSGTR